MKLNAILVETMPNIFAIVALLALGVIQLFMIFRHKKRRNIKLLLNGILWFLLLGLALNPKWVSSIKSTKILVFSQDIPLTTIEKFKDSLQIPKATTFASFIKKTNEFKGKNLVFLGQDGTSQELSLLAGKPVEWIPYFPINTLQKIAWNGIRQKGDLQTLRGKIKLSEPQTIKLTYADKVVDSLKLKVGFNDFTLRFPVFSLGRNQLSLQLGNKELLPIHFFSSKASTLKVLMLLDHPDFENKILAEFLGEQGYQVELITKVAKGATHQTTINKTPKNFTADLIITSPNYATDARIKRAFADGKGILFFGFQDVKGELDRINKALGLGFSSQRISNQEAVVVKNELTALPFKLTDKAYQKSSTSLPFFVQRNVGKVGVSLLNETFPLKLSGDSLSYLQVWSEILNNFLPVDSSLPTLKAPIFKDLSTLIMSSNSSIKINKDTISLNPSVVNPAVKSSEYDFTNSGWNKVNDSLEVYVEKPNPLAQSALWEQWIKENKEPQTITKTEDKTEIPEWIWLILILLSLTTLWIEPKI